MKIISSGKWDNNTSWEFITNSKLPNKNLCTGVTCVCLYNKRVLLTRVNRGWELPGGHIENDETIEQAAIREVYEETGAIIQDIEYIGYRKIISKKKVWNKNIDTYYPFPISYVPHFVATSENYSNLPDGKEVIESKDFEPQEAMNLASGQKDLIKFSYDHIYAK